MFEKILSFFSQKATPVSPEIDEALAQQWYDQKSSLMEACLGKEHDMVMHAIVPYAIGGGLDLYYFPNGIEGVGIATKELSDDPENGSTNDCFELYELVMFTQHPLDLDAAKNDQTPFGKAHSNINAVLNVIAQYSAQATLNPNETCEFPKEMDGVGGKCFIFAAYPPQSATDASAIFGVQAVIEIFRSEMEYARAVGGAQLLQKLSEAGHFPYSDLDREPVA